MSGFKPEQPVIVTTLDNGRRVELSRKHPPKVDMWVGIVVGPSVLGDDLWMVRKADKRGGKSSGVYTVPGREMSTNLKRRPNGKA